MTSAPETTPDEEATVADHTPEPADPAENAGERKRLLLIDGHSMAFRAFFAVPADRFTNSEGQQ